MPTFRSTWRARTRRRQAQWISVAVVAALAIGVILLSMLALERTAAERGGAAAPVPSFSDGPEPEPAGAPDAATPTPTPATPVAPVVDRAAARFLTLGSDGVMWRATAGLCAAGTTPLIERSNTGGETWRDVTPRYRDIMQVARLDPIAGSQAQAVAALTSICATEALRTYTQGQFWEPYPDELGTVTFIDPVDPATVVTPDGPIPAPCDDARSLRDDEITALICDREVFTLDGGSWTATGRTDAVALAVSGSDLIVAHTSAGCPGLAIDGACIDGTDPAAPTALASDGTTTWIWNGDLLSPVG